MARLFGRLGSLGAALGLLGGCCAVGIAPAAAADGTCTTSNGVLVVVDFGELGGGVQRGCAPGDPKTGLKALHAAGFSTTGTQRYGPSFMCRIDGKPGKAREKCVDTPPGDAYWAYWHTGKSGWTQSQAAATNYDPKPGTIEGWSFGAGKQPRITPAAARSGESTSATASPSAKASPPKSTARAESAKGDAGGDGPPVPTVVALVVVVGGGAAAGLVAWRRNRRGS